MPIDIPLLIQQKETLFALIQSKTPITLTPLQREHIEGILATLDALHDEAEAAAH